MSYFVLNERDYYRTVYGGWLGKNIGGTLGAPVEGKKELLNLDFYPVLPDGPLENDDLDLQLVWLHALEQYGPKLTCKELGKEWIEHIFFPFDEYGYALTNLRRGILPPVAGGFNNPFIDCMGSPIRSEIWGMVAPCTPHVAAYFAYQDSIVDHAGGEGVYGEMFFAAIESAIFMEKDRDQLIKIGMTYIPETCRTAKAINDLLRWYNEGKSWIEARELILKHHGHHNFTDAPQNIAFTVLGWLYGEDFEDSILKAVNCGYDTDCTAATLGAILGMIAGPEELPDKWVRPVGDRVVVSPAIKGFPAPRNLDELTKRTIRMGKQVLSAWETDIILHPILETSLDGISTRDNSFVRDLWRLDISKDSRLLPTGSIEASGLELIIDYGEGGPSISINQTKQMKLQLVNHSLEEWEGTIALEVLEGWQVTTDQAFKLRPGQSLEFEFHINNGGVIAPTYELIAVITRIHDRSVWSLLKEVIILIPASEWMLWGPNDEQGILASFAGNRISWEQAFPTEKDGHYRASTLIHNPIARKIRLITASNALIEAKLDGDEIISCNKVEEFIPAFHRAPINQSVDIMLPAGRHVLEISAIKDGERLEVFVLPVAGNETEKPGPHYYYTDVLFVTECSVNK